MEHGYSEEGDTRYLPESVLNSVLSSIVSTELSGIDEDDDSLHGGARKL